MEISPVKSLLFDQLSYRANKQKIISSNIANINTPGYKTKELIFENELEKVNKNDLKLKITNSNHISFNSLENKQTAPLLREVEGLEEQNDGNNVNLDSQMGEMSKNQMIFSALQQSIKIDSRLLRSVIDASSKN
ncbi:MAG: flagellar basal body rod protein FlgB [Campylobacterales bacterium]|nr:flagellar basal body rod protein FlgB [Campylobacterales bacterium]NQY52951.1 flagellar basal body rod protein FlgB [Campylobacteraceae bacterium]